MNKKILFAKAILVVAILVFMTSNASAQTFQFTTWSRTNEPIFTVDAFRTVTIDKRGNVWAGSDLGGLYSYSAGTWKKANTYADITFRHLVPSNIVGDSNVWVTSIGKTGTQATSGGAYYIDTKANTITQYGSGIAGGLGSRYGNSLAMSKSITYVALAQSITGTVTNQGGIYQISTKDPPPPSANAFKKAVQDIGDIVYQSAGNRGDELWFARGANCSGVCQAPYIVRMTNSGALLPPITATNSPLPFINTATSPFPRAIFTDTSGGNTFVGLSSGGVGVYKADGTWKLLTSSNSPFPAGAAVNFNAIADVYGEIWIGTTAGIFVYNGTGSLDQMSSFKMLTTANGLPSSNITDIALDTAASNLWLTSNLGISRSPFKPEFINGVVYNVYCNTPESHPDSLKLYENLQRKPFASDVIVHLLRNGTTIETSVPDANGKFELKTAVDNTRYTVQVYCQKGPREIIYKYPDIKNHTALGAILIPDSLIEEIKAFKPKLAKRTFPLKLLFNIDGPGATRDGFIVSDYEKAFEKYFDSEGISADHKLAVENLANFYIANAAVYKLGGTSTDMGNSAIKCALDFAECIVSFLEVDEELPQEVLESAAIKESLAAILRSYKDLFIFGLENTVKNLPGGADKKETVEMMSAIIVFINDLSDMAITLLEKDIKGVGKATLIEVAKKTAASQIAAFTYKIYCQEQHQNFISTAANSSANIRSFKPYIQTFSELYGDPENSLSAKADGVAARTDTLIQRLQFAAKVGEFAATLSKAASTLAKIPAAQTAAIVLKSIGIAGKTVKIVSLAGATVVGIKGVREVVALSDQILPITGLSGLRMSAPTAVFRDRSINNLQTAKDNYHLKLSEIQTIYNSPVYDPVEFASKFKQLTSADSAYVQELQRSLNAVKASVDSAFVLIPGFDNRLAKLTDTSFSDFVTTKNSFFFQNLAFAIDTDKTGYSGDLNSLVNELKTQSDSTSNGINSLLNEINTSGISSPAYLAQDSYTLDHSHLPGSAGTVRYTFTNYGTEPQNDVSFKLIKPETAYTFTSPDSIYVGTIAPGMTKEISFSFIAPMKDSLSRYAIDVNASNGSFKDVTGSLFVIDSTQAVLPLTLSKFDVTCVSTGSLLKWETTSETNTSVFNIEKSSDGNTGWTTLAKIPASGISIKARSYQFTDALSSNAYYRLKQIDLDGKFTYSNLKKADCAADGKMIVYPVPAKNKVTIVVSAEKNSKATIVLMDLLGKKIREKSADLKTGLNTLIFELGNQTNGEYILTVKNNGMLTSKRITID